MYVAIVARVHHQCWANACKVMSSRNILQFGSNGVMQGITHYILVKLLQLLSPVMHYNLSCHTGRSLGTAESGGVLLIALHFLSDYTRTSLNLSPKQTTNKALGESRPPLSG